MADNGGPSETRDRWEKAAPGNRDTAFELAADHLQITTIPSHSTELK